MELKLTLEIDNLFKAKDYEGKPGKWKIQTFDNIETDSGVQKKLIDISLPDEQYFKLKDSVGKVVTIPVRTYVNNGRVGYYGV